MPSKVEGREFAPSASYQVRDFVTKIWEHPLLDAKTKAFRNQAVHKLSDELVGLGFAQDEFITIPVGSVVWSANAESDFNYLLIFRDRKTLNRVDNKETDEYLRGKNINILKVPWFVDFNNRQEVLRDSIFANLFFTPDEYLAGNISLAQKLRQNVLDLYGEKENEYYWNKVVKGIFTGGYKYWEQDTGPISPIVDKPYKASRAERFNSALELRANQTSNPDEYKNAFLFARTRFNLPSLETYTKAMRESGGALALNPRSVAQGIR